MDASGNDVKYFIDASLNGHRAPVKKKEIREILEHETFACLSLIEFRWLSNCATWKDFIASNGLLKHLRKRIPMNGKVYNLVVTTFTKNENFRTYWTTVYRPATFLVLKWTSSHVDIWESGCTALRILNLDTKWRSVIGLILRPLYPRVKNVETHWQEAGWDPKPVWTMWLRENLCCVGNGTPAFQPEDWSLYWATKLSK